VVYTPAEVRTLTPVRESVEMRASVPDIGTSFFATRGTTGKDPQTTVRVLSFDAAESRLSSKVAKSDDGAIGPSCVAGRSP
jgi:hypothetical protein